MTQRKFYTVLLRKTDRRDKYLQDCYLDADFMVQELQWFCKSFCKPGDYMPELCSKDLFLRRIEEEREKRDDSAPIRVAKFKDEYGEYFLYVDFGYVRE